MRSKRNIESLLFLLIAVALGSLFLQLFRMQEKEFVDVAQRLSDGSMVNLNKPDAADRFANLLNQGYYYEDPKDISLIREAVAKGLGSRGEIDNIGELNKSAFSVRVEDAMNKGGISFKKRVVIANAFLGFTGADSNLYMQEKRAPRALPAALDLGRGAAKISGKIKDREGAAVAGVLVKLELVLPADSSYASDRAETDQWQEVNTGTTRKVFTRGADGTERYLSYTAFTRTDGEGRFIFSGLEKDKAYEVLPMQPGWSFGSSKGTASLDKELELSFTRSTQTMRLFAGRDFNNLKREKALIVREPAEVKRWHWIIVAVFFSGFLLLHLLLRWKLPQTDGIILPIVMMLTGISLLTLLSLQDPLRDRFLARSTLAYLGGGFVLSFLVLLFDPSRFTPDSRLYRMFWAKGREGEKGFQWAWAALALLLLTIVLGSGPEGSGVKVNLFGFQPSEGIKFMLLLFLAGFLATQERFISEYATARKRWNYFYPALAAVLLAILLFLMLGDLGPAMVVCFTFIILFSFSRGDLPILGGTVVLFVLTNWIIPNVWIATSLTVFILAAYLLFVYKRLSESSVLAFAVMAGFLLIDQLPLVDKVFPGPIQRLSDRKQIWQNKWDNEVYGGDQVANGIWGMSSGGVKGQGIGEGFAKTIPEAHTDMILPAIGEELGWMGILSLFILFLLFLHRSILIGRQTGRPFLFYLCTGIGISTFIQFILIAGGSTGALPLSGISLPFISYGGSSLVLNMMAAAFLLSASGLRGSEVQMNYITSKQDSNIMPLLALSSIALIGLVVNVSRYLFKPGHWVVQPALVADRSGARMFSYNPRIAILMNRLEAGNLYDRNGQLLATSKPSVMMAQRSGLIASGVADHQLVQLSRKRYDRYYPFGEHMFFWTGDANSGVFSGSMNGYFGEYELAAELRGFATPETVYRVKASKFREDRFLPAVERDMSVVRRDYSAIAYLLLEGINSEAVETFKQQNRDVQLCMDAALQTALQKSIGTDDSVRNKRISIVIREDNTGDVLTSANWPLPPLSDWEQLTLSRGEEARSAQWLTLKDLGFTHATQPGSTAKLATALAALNKHGAAIADKPFLVREQDLIRVRSAEPDEPGNITMQRAIVRSNNAYFIRLANEMRLEKEMAHLYLQTGMFLRGLGGYFYDRPAADPAREGAWMKTWERYEFSSVRRYDINNLRKTRGLGVSGMAWGQGELVATPAAIARLVSGIANGGKLVPERYVLKIADSSLATEGAQVIAVQPAYTELLTRFMKAQSAPKQQVLGMQVAGKTGTPERIIRGKRINDGWYAFFVPKAAGAGHIVVCIRIEASKGSSDAVRLAGKWVIPELRKRGYIKGFEAVAIELDEESVIIE